MKRVLMSFLLLACASVARAQFVTETQVSVQDGTLPILITAPHGGREAIPETTERTGNSAEKFVTVRDEFTDDVAEKLAAAIEKELGGKPFVVIARFARKHADANRAADSAYESATAKSRYDAYHAAIRKATEKITATFGRGLHLDLHGQAADRQAIFRGTNNGKTVAALTKEFGVGAFTGPKSVLGALAARGYDIKPSLDSKDREDPRFNGGYTVQTYGKAPIASIQLEMGLHLRSRDAQKKTADDIARAVATFAAAYLPKKPSGPVNAPVGSPVPAVRG